MNFIWFNTLASLALFAGMLLLLEVGRQIGLRRRAADPDGAQAGTGALDGAVFGLLGLLVAFTFSGAATRFDERRSLIVQETNDIGTAYLRVELLPESAQPAMRNLFRSYLDSRIEMHRTFQSAQDVDAALAIFDRSTRLQAEIWSQAVAGVRMEGASPAATMLLLPALNQMFDIASTRLRVAQVHPPPVIFGMLYSLALVSALLAGHGIAGSKRRNWIHILGFAAVIAGATNVIVDLEFPRMGLIRIDAFDQALVDLRAGMK